MILGTISISPKNCSNKGSVVRYGCSIHHQNIKFYNNIGCTVQGSGFRVQGSGFRVQGSEFTVQGSGFRVQGSGFTVHGLVTPTFRIKRSYKKLSNTYQFTQWMIVPTGYKQNSMGCD
jgi:hypothetical protein